MAKRQSRRSVSMRGTTYQRLRNYCKKHNKSASGITEELLTSFLDRMGEPEVLYADPPKPRAKKKETSVGGIFTF